MLNLGPDAEGAAEAQVQGKGRGPASNGNRNGVFAVLRDHVECAKVRLNDVVGGIGCGCQRRPVVKEVVAGQIVRRGDVIRAARLKNQEGIEGDAPKGRCSSP